jgi:hypothetical protein
MRAGKNKIRRLRAGLIMEWMAEFGFDTIGWESAVEWNGKAYESIGWDKIRHLETAKVLEELGLGGYRLNRDKAVRYMEKYL